MKTNPKYPNRGTFFASRMGSGFDAKHQNEHTRTPFGRWVNFRSLLKWDQIMMQNIKTRYPNRGTAVIRIIVPDYIAYYELVIQ